ncbi:MAG: ribosome-associated translation inhibitor RaiA [Candidatus Omnitrophica bacterium]|nr:ribosome-associated translation inhibitor RaiA [Candidatus Omnitrophota bacterium]
MQITVTARHIEIPPSFQELLRAKLEKLEHFGHKLVSTHAIFGRERYLYTAELTLLMKGATLVGRAKDERDLLTCAEEALMKLKEQLRRHESKQVSRLRRQVRKRKGV